MERRKERKKRKKEKKEERKAGRLTDKEVKFKRFTLEIIKDKLQIILPIESPPHRTLK